MSALRVYDPAECDEHGVPLDWERCRTCSTGIIHAETFDSCGGLCPTCDGHGSLKAAVLAERRARVKVQTTDPVRCEGCGHPMSDGTWEGECVPTPVAQFLNSLARSPDTSTWVGQHFSPCDEGCRHGGPVRYQNKWADPPTWHEADLGDGQRQGEGHTRQASWRQVDVRTLGWPHDLRPEKLAVLCLRCYADRTKPSA